LLFKELHNARFKDFKDTAETEKLKLKEQLELKQKEKDLNMSIKELTSETKKAEENFNKEDEKNTEEIRKLKAALNDAKNEASITLRYEKKFLEGKEDATTRQYKQKIADEQAIVNTLIAKIV